ncbi:MAG: magnesium transporter [Bacillota bacterium]|nr:magnesium transporter [Bacillota bacterium]HOA90348.1 magnesium transporter [Bacillota bacterium]HOJ46361.1 magnesium transporter [Bacillota bacterium]HPZ72465.1 magnesium transporter [Bacillota bacterium]
MNQTIYDLVEQKEFGKVKDLLTEMHPKDISTIIADLPEHVQGLVFRLLPKDLAVSVFENFDTSFQEELLQNLKSHEVISILNEMAPDDRTRLFEELPAGVVTKYLAMLTESERKIAYALLGYEEYTAGRLMTTDFLELREDYTISRAIEAIRATAPKKEAIYYGYVISKERELIGVISLRTLISSNPDDTVGELMNTSVICVGTDTPQEDVAAVMAHYDLAAVPVVDTEDRLVGIITHDDIIDVITEEDTEDIHLMGAVTTTDRSFWELTIWDSVKRRLGWLVLLIFLASFSTSILAMYENVLASVVALSFFIPLLIDTGGNAGTQSAAITIRALATGELKEQDRLEVVGKEVVSSLILGLMVGVVGGFLSYFICGDPSISLAVGVSMVAVVLLASVTGTVLPIIAVALNIDPAVMSGPFITTIVDITGLVTYFYIAKWILNLT